MKIFRTTICIEPVKRCFTKPWAQNALDWNHQQPYISCVMHDTKITDEAKYIKLWDQADLDPTHKT